MNFPIIFLKIIIISDNLYTLVLKQYSFSHFPMEIRAQKSDLQTYSISLVYFINIFIINNCYPVVRVNV
jgi:hypothetical protein